MSESTTAKSRFSLGRMVMTRGVASLFTGREHDLLSLLRRHARCDWGGLCDEDKASNDFALLSGGRLLSCYQVTPDQQVFIITERDRSYTTILLPSEY
ncbi:MAG: hypothetical protein MESAZ_03029 [Saezia sanguinis]